MRTSLGNLRILRFILASLSTNSFSPAVRTGFLVRTRSRFLQLWGREKSLRTNMKKYLLNQAESFQGVPFNSFLYWRAPIATQHSNCMTVEIKKLQKAFREKGIPSSRRTSMKATIHLMYQGVYQHNRIP